MTLEADKQTHGFQTEVKQLLQLMIHSLYSNKEIFLRELISNAADAADKLRFEALSAPSLLEEDPNLRIRVEFDKQAHTITIDDNGIGMSRDEAIAHLGTIAKSGTADFLKTLSGDQRKDANLIGQFGVGFYSAFIVADHVDVYSRRAGLTAAEGVHWSSKGEGNFEVATIDKPQRGTRVVLHLKENEQHFAEGWTLRSTLKNIPTTSASPLKCSRNTTARRKKKTPPKKPSGKPSTKPAPYGHAPKTTLRMRNTRNSINTSHTI